MLRLFRIPVVLFFAALVAGGAYAAGFLVLDDNFDIALISAAIGGVVITVVGLGSLSRAVWLILLGIPITVGAFCTAVYTAGVHHVDAIERFPVVVATAECTSHHLATTAHGDQIVCDGHAYTFTRNGQPETDRLNSADAAGKSFRVGDTVTVYESKPGTITVYQAPIVGPAPQVEKAARILVPVFVVYVVALGIFGAIGAAVRRRTAFLRHGGGYQGGGGGY